MRVLALLASAIALTVAGAAASRPESPTASAVRITMTTAACRAAPTTVEPGTTKFFVRNRTRKPRLFTIAGRRTRYVAPRRSRRISVLLSQPGVYRYFCISRGPRRAVRTGVVAVRPVPVPPPPPADHRIRIRLAGASGEFYDHNSGARFVPRGNTYLRLAHQELPDGRIVSGTSTFIEGLYDPARAEAALERMHADGYNTVRVILDVICRRGCLGDAATHGLSGGYLDNVADFIRRAKANDIYVLLANQGSVPAGTTWETIVNRSCCATFDGTNLYFLTADGLEGTRLFWRNLVRGLLNHRAPTDDILGYSLVGEGYFESDEPPLSLNSGTVTTANGRTYDLASPAQKQLMMDENLVNYVDRVRAAILEVDPTAPVAMGFIWPQLPNPTREDDPRVVRTGPVLTSSALDFVDFHLYPDFGLTFPEYVENYELPRETAKPVVMGEYGAYKFVFPTAGEAAARLVEWQGESCAYGFDGWFLSTWDTTELADGEPPDLWAAVEDGGPIERALGPASRPDPCAG
jgi:hypothetical protein